MARFRRPSPALLLALLALIVAVSSSAGANPIAMASKALSGSKLKKHSIPLSALSPAAVKALHGATGQQGPAGGTNVSVVSQACAPAPCSTTSVTCPAGTQEVGGGGLAVGNQLLFMSIPVTAGSNPIGWQVAGGAADPPAMGTVTAYALCASP